MNRYHLTIALIISLASGPAQSWELTGHYYYGSAVLFQLGDLCDSANYPGTPGNCSGDAANPDWRAAFGQAISRWNSATSLFDFQSDPGPGQTVPGTCDPFDPFSAFFLADICGVPFGSSTLAVAQTYHFPDGYAIHSDIIYNTAFTWDVFDDALANHSGVADFLRVTVHEAGHVLGLDHTSHTNAIMYFAEQDIISPRPDDLNGLISVYGELDVAVIPDTSGNAVQELVTLKALHDGSIRAEVRDANTGTLLKNLTFLSNSYQVLNGVVIPDQDGNGAPELAVLAIRRSDGRGVVEIRNLSGAEAPRTIWYGPDQQPLKVVAVNDADSNGVVELAVLSVRNADFQGLVEIKNAFGATLPHIVWLMNLSFTSPDVGFPIDLTTVDDADGNGVPEIAVLSKLSNNGRGYVEIKNASGPTAPNTLWAMAGVTAKSLIAISDADSNGVPEIGILSTRDSDGRIVVEVKNASGPTAPNAVWFATGHHPIALSALPDVDGNGAEEIAVLSRRDSDGRILVEVKNASGATNPNPVWFSPGFEAAAVATVVNDADGNSVVEVAVLLSRPSDGRLVVQERNARGAAAARNVWLTP